MNLDQPCGNCGRGRGRHAGETYQGACPVEAGFTPDTPYMARCWRPAPRLLHGGGPWAISPDCPSRRMHNTAHGAKGKSVTERCECPRGRDLREADLQFRKDQRAILAIAAGRVPAAPRVRVTPAVDPTPVFECGTPKPTDVRPPNFLGAMCQQPWAQEIVDRSFTLYGGRGGVERREDMRSFVCGQCPFRKPCAEWVLEAEQPAGSWGGMYGGMDVWNRDGRELYVGVEAVQERPFDVAAYVAGL